MVDFSTLLSQGNSSALLFIPSAILLGALHGLEPGHSKTMMAAFIVAIKGTVKQAILLGVAATISHTAIVWLIAMGGMYLSKQFTAEASEPWLQIISGGIILLTAIWMFWRNWAEYKEWKVIRHIHHHEENSGKNIDTGHGIINIAMAEVEGCHRLVFKTLTGHAWHAEDIVIHTTRSDGEKKTYFFIQKGGGIFSEGAVTEPDHFSAKLELGHRNHLHRFDFTLGHHDHPELEGLDSASDEYQDAHEKAHANEIKHRFHNKNVSNSQILLFGLTGGLIPCPAAITVLLICIQMKKVTLGATLVFCFSIGLAITLLTVGVGAALGVRHLTRRWNGFSSFARVAPYLSSLLIAVVGVYMAIHGLTAIIG
ncbi:nickel/cobalt efflux protein RcnA [Tatumella ptyseos]|uniref:nickel/cobalt efflux protein RcnA n=1 Tax=Tatumella ptyseos TaxID=82987 RepID=UPI0026EF9161|nr:nickel/cobalt efflux protein RcnA [Tatumella ptyseos]WKX26931.1 nickel/cobalt efflux protein RcnA [Tatumella ptyseos]